MLAPCLTATRVMRAVVTVFFSNILVEDVVECVQACFADVWMLLHSVQA